MTTTLPRDKYGSLKVQEYLEQNRRHLKDSILVAFDKNITVKKAVSLVHSKLSKEDQHDIYMSTKLYAKKLMK